MKRLIPERIEIDVLNERSELIDYICLNLIFHSDYKNHFGILITPLNCINKRYIISKEQIIEQANNATNIFIMDYGYIENSFTSEIDLFKCTSKDLKGALNAYNIWKKHLKYPVDYENTLRVSLQNTEDLERNGEFDRLNIICKAIPSAVKFSIIKSPNDL